MDYLLRIDTESQTKLLVLFEKACRIQGVQISRMKSAIILVKFLDDAKKEGLLEEVPEVTP